jgi:hypothetical protein
MQLDAQLWSNLLWLSGGMIKLGKCSFHQIHYDFESDGTPIMRLGIYGEALQVHNVLTNQQVTSKVSAHTTQITRAPQSTSQKNKTQCQVLQTNLDT